MTKNITLIILQIKSSHVVICSIVLLKVINPICRLPKVKEKIIQELEHQAEENLGMAMTYTLFEWFRENQESLLVDQSDAISDSAPEVILTGAIDELSLGNQVLTSDCS